MQEMKAQIVNIQGANIAQERGEYFEPSDGPAVYDIRDAIKLLRKPGRVFVWVQLIPGELPHYVTTVKADLIETLEDIERVVPEAVVELTRIGNEWIVGF